MGDPRDFATTRKRADRYPLTMEELRRSCPLVTVDVVSDGKGGDILTGKRNGEVHIRVACSSVNKGAIKKFQEAYGKALQIGIIGPPAPVLTESLNGFRTFKRPDEASPKSAVPAANVVSIDKAGSSGKPVDEVPVEDEPV